MDRNDPPSKVPALVVAVIGAGDAQPGEVALAEAVGQGIAARGAHLVCGGLGGVMAAACRGAQLAGGTTIGILPGTDRAGGNRWLDVAIATGLGEARNALVVRAADAVVAVGGGYGTLSEIGFALKTGRPVVGLQTWELSRHGTSVDAILRAGDAREAVAMALAAAGRSA